MEACYEFRELVPIALNDTIRNCDPSECLELLVQRYSITSKKILMFNSTSLVA